MIADTLPPREYSEEASDYPAPIAPAETDDHADNEVYADAAATESEQDLAESLDGASDRDEDTPADVEQPAEPDEVAEPDAGSSDDDLPEDLDIPTTEIDPPQGPHDSEADDLPVGEASSPEEEAPEDKEYEEDIEPPVDDLSGDEEEPADVDYPKDTEETEEPDQPPTDVQDPAVPVEDQPDNEEEVGGSTNDRDGGSGHPDETTTGFDDPEDPDLGDDAEDNPEAADDVADPTEYLGRVATEEEVETVHEGEHGVVEGEDRRTEVVDESKTEETAAERIVSIAEGHGVTLGPERLDRLSDTDRHREYSSAFRMDGLRIYKTAQGATVDNDLVPAASIHFAPEDNYDPSPEDASRYGLLGLRALQDYMLLVDSGYIEDPPEVLWGHTNEPMAQIAANLLGFEEWGYQYGEEIRLIAPLSEVRERVFSPRIHRLESALEKRIQSPEPADK